MVAKVNVLDAQLDTLRELQAAAIEHSRHQASHARHVGEHLACFLFGKNGRQMPGFLGVQQGEMHLQVLVQHLAVQKEQGAEGLILR